MGETRRGFLRVAGGTALGCGAVTVGTARAATVEATGRLLAHDGTPVAGRRVVNYYESSFDTYTDSDGYYSAQVDAGARVGRTLYKQSRGQRLAPVQNGVPHIYNAPAQRVPDDGDLGEFVLPEASVVHMRALTADGDPVRGANAGARHGGAGIGSSAAQTRSDGYAYIGEGEADGIELAGPVKLSMSLPTRNGEMSYSTETTVSAETTARFRVGDGATVGEPTPESDAASTVGTEAAATEEATATDTAETAVRTADATATPTSAGTGAATGTPGVRRGFISNGAGADDLGPLNDPFVLTVGGFALSVAGIAHNLVRGA
jgi:hypothetical protein